MTRFNEIPITIRLFRSHFGKILSTLLIAISILITAQTSSASAADPTLTWYPNEDADYYQVYMRGDGETEYSLVSNQIPAGTTSFKLMPSPNGKTYHFAVKAFNSCGNSSDFSDDISTTHIPYDPMNITSNESPVEQEEPATTEPINLEIILPEDASFGIAGSIMELSANVFKGLALRTDYIITWTSSIDGNLGVGFDINATLSAGVHIIMATSTDETGTTASATIMLYIQEVNTEPSVEITEFSGGVSGSSGQIFSFKAKATDAQDGDLSQAINWSSNISGQLGTGASIQATLSSGEHTVTAQVMDSNGLIKTASVNVTAIAFNSPPTLTVLELQKGDITEQSMVVDIYGNASDLEEGDISAKISWVSSISGALGKGSHIRVTLVPGTHIISGTVIDSGGKQGNVSQTITIDSYNYAPTLTITHSLTGTLSDKGQTCEISGTAVDREDGNIGSSISWASNIIGYLGSGARITPTLTTGNHTITGTVKDSQGKTTTSQIVVNVGVYNHPPEITMGPSHGSVLDSNGQAYDLNATASDAEDGNISAFITWDSNIDGYLGTGSHIATCLSSGEHVITANVSDSKSVMSSKTLEINVGVFNSTPALTLGSSYGGELNASGQAYRFTGTASDPEDGNLNSFITWNSNKNGYLGTGPDITTTLSPGAHVITASVNDRLGKTVSKTLGITVATFNTAPSITTPASVPGTLDANGQRYGFSASAIDSEDGNLSSTIIWNSNKDGSLGVGSSIQTTLSAGFHTITAQVADTKGKTAVASAQVTVALYNTPPVISFASTTAGTLDQTGQAYTLSGIATDKEDGNIASSITWTSSKDGYLGRGVTLQTKLTPGSHTITAAVTDSMEKVATAVRSVSVSVFNFAPEIAITSFIAAPVGLSGQNFEFSGSASDKEDGNLSAYITWTSSIKGYLGTGSAITTTLTAGNHTITARITDSQGKTTSVIRAVTAEAPNSKPTVAIQSVSKGTITPTGQTCTLSGNATDKEDGNLSSSIAWASTVNGTLGKGSNLTKTLSPGSHVIKAIITDSKGLTSESTRNLTVETYNNLPTVTEISYLKGASTLNGQAYTFSSSASDKEDGDLNSSISWTSSLSGALGNGSSIRAVLSSGNHTITARATDSKGKTGQTTKVINVTWANIVPSVQILQITPGAAGEDGQVHKISGTAVDEEEGNLSSSIAWTSDRDGNLGKGSEILSTLRSGPHTITATSCDSKGACSKTTRTITVATFNSPPVVSINSAMGGRQDATGQVFEFSAKASDTEEGSISSRITWTSSLDGNLGQGALIKPHLSVGPHTITAKVVDNKGKESSQTITVSSLKETRLALTVTTKSLYRFKITSITWKGGASNVVIYKNGNKVGTGSGEGTRYYWYSDYAKYKVCDGAGLNCSETLAAAPSKSVRKQLFKVRKSFK
ncbi:MAG: hypothetical protein WC799_06955 [Desulfobacteraceae bacterium]